MQIQFEKVDDDRHRVSVERRDGTVDTVVLDTRSFLRHDLAHLAVELEVGLRDGVWGSVARGGSLAGDGLDGGDMAVAESLAGPVQTLMRTEAGVPEIDATLRRVAPDLMTPDLATRIHGRLRALRGHWAATRFGDVMTLEWPD